MLPGMHQMVDSTTTDEHANNDTTTGASRNSHSSHTDSNATHDLVEMQENQHLTEKRETIRQMQTLRGFKRENRSKFINYDLDLADASEDKIRQLQPKKGNAKVYATTSQIRYVLDQYKQKQPIIETHHAFDFGRASWELVYNLFWLTSFPLIVCKEGMAGLRARQMFEPWAILINIPLITCTVSFILASWGTKRLFLFPFCVLYLLNIGRSMILAIKYGYYPSSVLAEYNDAEHPIKFSYIASHLLIPGWLMQNPQTVGRELYYSEQRLSTNLSALRMTFRDTKAFDMKKSGNCSCSRYWTTVDWLLPYIMNDRESMFITTYKFLVWTVAFVCMLYYCIVARVLPWSIGRASGASMKQCDTYCWLLIASLPLALAICINVAFLWSMSMCMDFSRRWSRLRLVTHLLDPRRETFQGDMRKSYRSQLFGTVSKMSAKKLKLVDLQTIDVYSSETLYAWSQLRNILLDAGHSFLVREQAYNGVLLFSVIVIIVFLIYCLLAHSSEDVDDESALVVIVVEDVFITLILALFVLAPAMWTLSCAESLNYQTTKQQRILSERAVEMLHAENRAKNNKMKYWVEEINKARSMCTAVVDVLNLQQYDVTLLGVKVDNAVFQLTGYSIGLLLYLLGWLVYTRLL